MTPLWAFSASARVQPGWNRSKAARGPGSGGQPAGPSGPTPLETLRERFVVVSVVVADSMDTQNLASIADHLFIHLKGKAALFHSLCHLFPLPENEGEIALTKKWTLTISC